MTVLQKIKQFLFSGNFDPFNLDQLRPPKTLRSGRFSVDLDMPFDPYEGFSESTDQLAADLNKTIKKEAR